jgi:3-methylcrotonyl-CoA carboxylase alpha subunit
MHIGNRAFTVTGSIDEAGTASAMIDGTPTYATIIAHAGVDHLFYEGRHFAFTFNDPLDVERQHHAAENSLLAPMPGRVVAQLVKPGDKVKKGAPLMVLEAMKMECTIQAPAPGSVREFHFAAGDQVTEGVELLHFDRDKTEENEAGKN